MNNDLAKQLSESVSAFYEKQGAWFATTRGKILPEHTFVAEYIRAGMTVADVGAGNGRFAQLLTKEVNYLGIEPSTILRDSASVPPLASHLLPGSLPHLPIPDQTADVTVCLAVLHHIPSQSKRQASVEELIRITKPNGIILATSWLNNPHSLKTIPIENGEEGDMWMPWTSPDNKTDQRFVHFMQGNEWQKLWTHTELEIIKIGMYGKQDWTDDSSQALNWRVIAKRKDRPSHE